MPVNLLAHDPSWSKTHAMAAAEIDAALKRTAVRIEHVGSTAVPGLLAKPVIDVLILVTDYDSEDAYSVPLGVLGFARDHRDESHVLFKSERGGVQFHLHVVETRASDSLDMVLFRDYLRQHPDEAVRYADLKRSLAASVGDGEYAAGKTAYVREVVRRALSN